MAPRFTSPDGELTIETAIPSEAASLRNQGFTEEKARTKAVQQAEKEQAASAPAPKKS